MELANLKEVLEDKIAENKVGKCLNFLRKILTRDCKQRNSAIMASASISSIDEGSIKGVISNENERINYAKARNSALYILGKIEVSDLTPDWLQTYNDTFATVQENTVGDVVGNNNTIIQINNNGSGFNVTSFISSVSNLQHSDDLSVLENLSFPKQKDETMIPIFIDEAGSKLKIFRKMKQYGKILCFFETLRVLSGDKALEFDVTEVMRSLLKKKKAMHISPVKYTKDMEAVVAKGMVLMGKIQISSMKAGTQKEDKSLQDIFASLKSTEAGYNAYSALAKQIIQEAEDVMKTKVFNRFEQNFSSKIMTPLKDLKKYRGNDFTGEVSKLHKDLQTALEKIEEALEW